MQGSESMLRALLCSAVLSLAGCSSSSTNDNANATGGSAGSGGTGTGGNAGVAGSQTGGNAGSLPFPQTPVIDDFEYTGLATATKWQGAGSAINWTSNGELTSPSSDPATLLTNATYGAKQEAFMTLTKFPPNGGIYLFFSGKACESAYLKYDPAGFLHVGREAQTGACTDVDVADVPLDLSEGDQLGVRTRDDGTIDVFVNGSFFQSFEFIATAGPIGLGADLTGAPSGATVSVDDFGGGNLP